MLLKMPSLLAQEERPSSLIREGAEAQALKARVAGSARF